MRRSSLPSQSADQWVFSKFKGTDVLGPDDAQVGDVNDILFDKQGKILEFIVGVGFLGIGEKSVAIDMRRSRSFRYTGSTAAARRPMGSDVDPTNAESGDMRPGAVKHPRPTNKSPLRTTSAPGALRPPAWRRGRRRRAMAPRGTGGVTGTGDLVLAWSGLGR